MESGPCTVFSDGECVGRPSGYSNSEACTISATNSFTLSHCSVGSGYDQLVIDGTQYYNCPVDMGVTPASSITWSSDDSNPSNVGWQICRSSGNLAGNMTYDDSCMLTDEWGEPRTLNGNCDSMCITEYGNTDCTDCQTCTEVDEVSCDQGPSAVVLFPCIFMLVGVCVASSSIFRYIYSGKAVKELQSRGVETEGRCVAKKC